VPTEHSEGTIQNTTQRTDVTFHCDRFWLKERASWKVSAKLVHLDTFH
jgi:hypothetical protein